MWWEAGLAKKQIDRTGLPGVQQVSNMSKILFISLREGRKGIVMKKRIDRDGLEVLALEPPTELTKTALSELENDSDLFVACDGSLYHIDSEQIDVDYIMNAIDDNGPCTFADIEKWTKDFLDAIRKIIKKCSLFEQIAPVELMVTDDSLMCVFIDRKATKKERTGWLGYRIEHQKKRILQEERGLIKSIRDAKKAGLKVSLTSTQVRLVDRHNEDIKRIMKKEYGSLLLKVDEE